MAIQREERGEGKGEKEIIVTLLLLLLLLLVVVVEVEVEIGGVFHGRQLHDTFLAGKFRSEAGRMQM